jgi:uncharacterized protein (TIGR04222 family)
MNPFELTAGPFLTLYGLILAGAVLAIVLLRQNLGPEAPAAGGENLGPLDYAYLSGGFERAADTVLLGLMVAGAAKQDARTHAIDINPDAAPLPAGLQRFGALMVGATTRTDFHTAVIARLKELELPARLTRFGLLPDAAARSRLRLTSLCVFAVPVILGAIRIVLGVSREKPIGILIVLMVVTVILGVAFVGSVPRRTRAGTLALEDAREHHARAARAPLPVELPLAFALTGAAVLAGTDYAPLAAQIKASGDGGGSGGDSGGGDGGGGGGCGGCSG